MTRMKLPTREQALQGLRWFLAGAEADETTLVAIGLVLTDDEVATACDTSTSPPE